MYVYTSGCPLSLADGAVERHTSRQIANTQVHHNLDIAQNVPAGHVLQMHSIAHILKGINMLKAEEKRKQKLDLYIVHS